MKKNLNFNLWLSSPNAVSFTLAIGVIFLINNYQNIIYRANPDNTTLFVYPFAVQVLLSHLDSLFFGLSTAIIIFQSQKDWHKAIYCLFESIMIFLNLNRTFISDLGYNSQFLLGIYIAIFSGFTLFYLGTLAKQHTEQLKSLTEPEIAQTKKETSIQDYSKFPSEETVFDLLTKYPKTTQALKDGLSLYESAKLSRISKSTAAKIRTYLKATANGVSH